MANPVGSPRIHDRAAIAKQMLEWAKKEDSINLCGFSTEICLPPSLLIKWSKEPDEFGEAYERVKAILGVRREKMLSKGQLHVKAYDLNAKTYDAYLKEEHRDDRRFESELDANKEESVPLDYKQAFEGLTGMIKDAQSSARNKAATKSKAE